MAGEYEVGYRRPPKTTRFKPGQSGNPKGRPAKARNFKSDVKKTLETPIRLVKDGKPQTVSTRCFIRELLLTFSLSSTTCDSAWVSRGFSVIKHV